MCNLTAGKHCWCTCGKLGQGGLAISLHRDISRWAAALESYFYTASNSASAWLKSFSNGYWCQFINYILLHLFPHCERGAASEPVPPVGATEQRSPFLGCRAAQLSLFHRCFIFPLMDAAALGEGGLTGLLFHWCCVP